MTSSPKLGQTLPSRSVRTRSRAAVHRLAGFGDQVEVLDPPAVRAALLAIAREILRRYQAGR
jgi:predicted DNA-binding transcriptional regulator YafY